MLRSYSGLVNFEWDEAKSLANSAKHGLSLDKARALWNGPVIVLKSRHPGEPRQLALGKIGALHWTIIFTLRGGNIRLISARRSRDNERNFYDENQRQKS